MSLSFSRLIVVCEAIYRPMIGLVPARRERSSNLRNNQNSSRKSYLMIKRHPSIKGRQRSTYENQFCLNVDFSQNRKQRWLQMIFLVRLTNLCQYLNFELIKTFMMLVSAGLNYGIKDVSLPRIFKYVFLVLFYSSDTQRVRIENERINKRYRESSYFLVIWDWLAVPSETLNFSS